MLTTKNMGTMPKEPLRVQQLWKPQMIFLFNFGRRNECCISMPKNSSQIPLNQYDTHNH